MTRSSAFTLVELLVVITIIVVLLALLLPAVDKAIYQAELTVCGTQQSAVALGLSMYAMDHKRQYPARSVSAAGPAEVIYAKSGAAGVNLFLLDDRPMYEGYIELDKSLSDPMLPPIEITDNVEATPSGTEWLIYTPITIWAGYHNKDGSPMSRVGGRMVYVDGSFRASFNVVAGDTVLTSGPDPSVWGRASHPDKEGLRRQKWQQNGPYTTSAQGQTFDTSRTQTFAQWIGRATSAVDLNFAFQDGSVRRFNDVLYGDNPLAGQPDSRDERMEKIRHWGDKAQTTDFTQLPRSQ